MLLFFLEFLSLKQIQETQLPFPFFALEKAVVPGPTSYWRQGAQQLLRGREGFFHLGKDFAGGRKMPCLKKAIDFF